MSCLTDRALYAPWAPMPLSIAQKPDRFGRCEMSASLLANSSCAVMPVQRMLGRAYTMYSAGAYVHHYAEHGLGRDEFEDAFSRVEDVLAAYRSL